MMENFKCHTLKAKLELVIHVIYTMCLKLSDPVRPLFQHLTMLRMKDKAVAFLLLKKSLAKQQKQDHRNSCHIL